MDEIDDPHEQVGHSHKQEVVVIHEGVRVPGDNEDAERNNDAEDLGKRVKQEVVAPARQVQSNQDHECDGKTCVFPCLIQHNCGLNSTEELDLEPYAPIVAGSRAAVNGSSALDCTCNCVAGSWRGAYPRRTGRICLPRGSNGQSGSSGSTVCRS